jgi:hypothetical protein
LNFIFIFVIFLHAPSNQSNSFPSTVQQQQQQQQQQKNKRERGNNRENRRLIV